MDAIRYDSIEEAKANKATCEFCVFSTETRKDWQFTYCYRYKCNRSKDGYNCSDFIFDKSRNLADR